jgi:SAM-dependent methyltransferase
MAIDITHQHLYHSWFDLVDKGKHQGEVLISGVQDIDEPSRKFFDGKRVSDLFASRGLTTLEVDFDDPRAGLVHDLSKPFDDSMRNRFSVVFDIGTIEHVADTVSVFRNYFTSLRVGGLIFLLTPIRGYFDHGFHTFSEEFVIGVFAMNGFEILEKKYASESGLLLQSPLDADSSLILIAARKANECGPEIRLPIQNRWQALKTIFGGVQ